MNAMQGLPKAAIARLIVAGATTITVGCSALQSSPRPLEVVEVNALPDFETDAWAYGRDAGNSVRLGSEVLWVFGDTFGWSGMQCATAAWSPPERPHDLEEPYDDWFNPFQFYSFSPAEREFNEAHETPPTCCKKHDGCDNADLYCHCPKDTDCGTRIAIWPGDLIARDTESAVQYYEKVWVGSAPYDFNHLGTGIATVEYRASAAHRPQGSDGEPVLLFQPDEPNFLRAVLGREEGEPLIYLYAVTNRRECKVDITLARVPRSAAFDRSAYTFWNGDGWTRELAETRPILADIEGGLGSVTWNDHLRQYVSAFNDICSGGTHLVMRTAPRPEGPWSEPQSVDLRPLGGTKDAYAGQIHTSLGSGQSVVFSFYQPQELGVGRVRLGQLVFR